MNQNYRGENKDREDRAGLFVNPARQTHLKPQQQSESGELLTTAEDLSGCLASQGFAVKKVVAQNKVVVDSYRDEDLSGCLASGFLRPRKTAPKISQSADSKSRERDDTSGEISTSDEEASDWLYLN
jgi:hypothetical protein